MVTSLAKQVSDLRRLIEARGHASSTPLYFRLDPDQDEATALNELLTSGRISERRTAQPLRGCRVPRPRASRPPIAESAVIPVTKTPAEGGFGLGLFRRRDQAQLIPARARSGELAGFLQR